MSFWLSTTAFRGVVLWTLGSVGMTAWLGSGLWARTGTRKLLVPGSTSSGHYQIELSCEACHTDPFGGREALQTACLNCHGQELKEARDSHPEAKFTDPRNLNRIATLDARYCVTCHAEHQPEKTRLLGVTQPADFCVHCHADIAEERPSHEDFTFESCGAGGCHNFHDNRALYEDFLVKHADAPETLPSELPLRDVVVRKASSLSRQSVQGFLEERPLQEHELLAWEQSAHAAARVGCADCHGDVARFVARPGFDACRTCHDEEVAGWQSGRHGMRAAQGLPALLTTEARLSMKASAHPRSPDCNACHQSHGYDTRAAAVEACIGCHDDEHTKGYEKSRHAALFQDERLGRTPPGSGVSCATCHLPRNQDQAGQTHVVHNQNDNLRPNEKMVRSVCLSCHSLRFALDALSDTGLVRDNFRSSPTRQVRSIDMARSRNATDPHSP